MQALCCCIVLGFPCFFHVLRSPTISGTGDGCFRRSPLVEFGVEAPTFAVWGGRSTVARLRGARENRYKTGHTEACIAVKIQNERRRLRQRIIPGI